MNERDAARRRWTSAIGDARLTWLSAAGNQATPNTAGASYDDND
jgi:hypothetical protein